MCLKKLWEWIYLKNVKWLSEWPKIQILLILILECFFLNQFMHFHFNILAPTTIYNYHPKGEKIFFPLLGLHLLGHHWKLTRWHSLSQKDWMWGLHRLVSQLSVENRLLGLDSFFVHSLILDPLDPNTRTFSNYVNHVKQNWVKNRFCHGSKNIP